MKKFILLIIEKIRKVLKVDEKGNSFGWRKGMLSIVALMMIGCSFRSGQDISNKIITLDSCEYIQYWTGDYNQNIEHKGNCRFCEERDSIKWKKRRKELKELIIKLKYK